MEELRRQQREDEVCKQLIKYCESEWPERSQLPGSLKAYWSERSKLTVQDGLLMKDNRIVIPIRMRLETLDKIHESHQGITKCKREQKHQCGGLV